MSESLQELNAGEAYQTAFEQNMEQAESDFFAQADAIIIKVQHLVLIKDDYVEINSVPKVAQAIQEVSGLAYYDLKVTVDGKYKAYDVVFGYDFTKQASDLLADELGYTGALL